MKQPWKFEIIWFNATIFATLHVIALYGIYFYFTSAKIPTMIYYWIYLSIGTIGVTGGTHRLWAHRSYKARLPLRIILMLMQCIAHQNSIYQWVRDHRAHHKYMDTDADPHNSQRGFFFSHIGWLMVKKHPDIRKLGSGIDMKDVANDPVVAFQKKYYYVLMPLMCIIIPTLVPVHFWHENLKVAFFITILRYTMSLHFTWLVNSAAHMWGWKPYNKFMSPADNVVVALLTHGEGWHNYHHVFPWDYKTAELGNYRLNLTTAFIDFFASIGLAYDLKTVPKKIIKKRAEKNGDGTWDGRNMKAANDGVISSQEDNRMSQEDKREKMITKTC